MSGLDRGFEFWRKCLLCACVLMGVFGVGLVFFDTRMIVGPFNEEVARALWGEAAMPAEVVTYHRFVHAVLGATVAGWALTMVFVVQHAFRRKERWAWWALLSGPALWFVLDAGSSLYFGVWPNAILNVASYLPLAVPLAFTWRAFDTTVAADSVTEP